MSPNRSLEHSSPQEERSLALLVERLTAQLQAGERIDPALVARDYPEHAAELVQVLPALQALADLERSGLPSSAPHLRDSEGQPELLGELGDFRLLREVGRGGMGIVYEAEQISLGRRVALKMLPFAATLDPRQLQRFHNEARAAACLHHPHIVPVYGVGCERGVHYYSMQFVEGVTLTQVIRDLPRTGPEPSGADDPTGTYTPGQAGARATEAGGSSPTAPVARLATAAGSPGTEFYRAAARLGIQAAEALEHAHSMGVIHRDVKPGNLMLDAAGKLWVTDFGLARFGADAGLTMTGDLLGTLRYMSPEQALAKHGLVDHRTDVYSLGVTLYELLTSRPALTGDDRQEVLRKIAFEEPPRPRRLNPAIPAELEMIVLKAIAKEPPQRYQGAEELAEDLRRFLADRPIRARRATQWEQFWRWCRRNPLVAGLSTTAVLAGVLAVTALAVGIALVWREKEQKEAAYRAEVAQRQRADARTEFARQVVDDMYTRVAEKWLASQPGMTTLQRQFLEKALAFYEELAREQGTDPVVRFKTAQAYHFVARIQSRMGHLPEAELAYRRQIALLEELVRDYPGERKYHFDLFFSHMSLTDPLQGLGRQDERDRVQRKAYDLIEELARQFPDEPDYQDALAAQGINLGQSLAGQGRWDEAERLFRSSVAIAERLGRKHRERPEGPHYRANVARGLRALSDLMLARNDLPRAEQVVLEALGVVRTLADDYPKLPDYRITLVGWQLKFAHLLFETGRYAEAEKLLEQILPGAAKLAQEFPGLVSCRSNVAGTHWLRANVCWASGKEREAASAFQLAVHLVEEQIKEFSETPRFKHELAGSLCLCPRKHLRREARALELAEEACRLVPNPELLGMACYRAGKWQECITELQKLGPALNAETLRARLFLAMAHWQGGEKGRARQAFDETTAWTDRNKPLDTVARWLRAEAAELMGREDPPAHTRKGASHTRTPSRQE